MAIRHNGVEICKHYMEYLEENDEYEWCRVMARSTLCHGDREHCWCHSRFDENGNLEVKNARA